jgi:ribosomal protein S18 acetylase RimI-like enzyme
MEIRNLAIEDYDGMIQLWLRADLPIRIKGRDSKSAIESQMRSSPDFFIGAFEKSSLIGVVVVSSDGRKGWINRLAVDPGYRGKGIAKSLVAEAEKVLRKQGMQVFSTLIEDSNIASKGLFRKCGYVEYKDIMYFSKRDNNEV